MTTWHFYTQQDGLFTGASITTDRSKLVSEATPEGCGAIEGVSNWRLQRVGSGGLEEYLPPLPAGTALETWSRGPDGLPQSHPTGEALARAARRQRAAILLTSDWTESPGAQARLGPIKAAQWAAYRQALFDLTDQPGFPTTINWPVAPA